LTVEVEMHHRGLPMARELTAALLTPRKKMTTPGDFDR
jgi:hypothetical protein